MICGRRWILLALASFVMSETAIAQSPRDRLADLVGKLQTNDNVYMREAIIKLARTITPPPAIPEEARRAFVEGVTIVKSAKDSSSLALAIESFKVASKAAPWWSDAYFNIASTQELAGQLDDAKRSFEYFVVWFPDGAEAREAQDRIYAIGAKQRLAAVETAGKQAKANLRVAFVAELQAQFGNRRYALNEHCGTADIWGGHGGSVVCGESDAAGSSWASGARAGSYTWMAMVNPGSGSIDITSLNWRLRFRFESGMPDRIVAAWMDSDGDVYCGAFKGAEGTEIDWVYCKTGLPVELRFGRTSEGRAMIEKISDCNAARVCKRERWVLE